MKMCRVLLVGLFIPVILFFANSVFCQEAYYQFDENSWDGSVGQVLDRSANNYHATAVNGPNTAAVSPAIPGNLGTCSYGVFDGVDDYLAVPSSFPNITTNFSITAWIRTSDRTRSGQRILIDDPNNTAGFGFSLGDGGTGMLRFFSRSTNPISLDTPNVVLNNTWYFVAAVADISNKIKKLYIYDQAGNQVAAVSESYTGSFGYDTGDASMGGENDLSNEPGPNFHFVGNIDEVRVHEGALTESQIQAQRTRTHLCVPPVAEYHFDLCSETDTVIDDSGNGFNGLVLNGPLAIKQGKVCNGAYFDGVDDYVQIDDSDLFDNTKELTIAGWINPESIRVPPAGTNARGIVSKRNDASSNVSYGVFFYSSVADGRLYVDIDTTNNRFASNAVIPEEQWTHFAVVFNGNLPVNERVTLYINGIVDKIAPESSVSIPDYNSNLYIGNLRYGVSELKVYKGMIDELRIIPQVLSGADIFALYNETRMGCGSCDGQVDHYRMFHDGMALTCSPENIQIKACLDESCSEELSDPVDVELTPEKWLAGNAQTILSGDTLQLLHSTAETVFLSLFGPGGVPNATNPPRCFIGATEQADCRLTFHDSGFAFDVPNHIAAIEQDLVIAAVRKDLETEQCVPGFQNVTRNIFFSSGYLDPVSGTVPVEINNTSISGFSPGTALILPFDSNGEAHIKVRYADVGQMMLTAYYQGSGDDAGLVMTGGDSFVTRPDHFMIHVPDNPAAADADGGIFKKAGELFSVEVAAYNADGEVTPNYGQEALPETVRLTQTLVAPAAQHNPSLLGSFQQFGFNCDGSAIPGYACGQFKWPEVGIISLSPDVGDGDYLGSGNVTGNPSNNVGRFVPDHFEVSILPDPPVFSETCLIYTYLGEPFTWENVPELTIRAMNGADPPAVTENYEGAFWKLGATVDYSYVDANVPGTAAPFTPQTVSRSMPDTANCNGLVTLQLEDAFNYSRPGIIAPIPPPAPFTPDVTMSVSAAELTDSDLVCNHDGTGCREFRVSGITGTHMRYGRAVAEAVFGPEISPLVMPVSTYWHDGNGWLKNEDDDCTSFSYALTPSGTNVGSSPAGPVAMHHGATELTLTPVAGAGRGTVSVSCNFPDWLHPDPVAVATFGIARGNDRIINWQEIMR